MAEGERWWARARGGWRWAAHLRKSLCTATGDTPFSEAARARRGRGIRETREHGEQARALVCGTVREDAGPALTQVVCHGCIPRTACCSSRLDVAELMLHESQGRSRVSNANAPGRQSRARRSHLRRTSRRLVSPPEVVAQRRGERRKQAKQPAEQHERPNDRGMGTGAAQRRHRAAGLAEQRQCCCCCSARR